MHLPWKKDKTALSPYLRDASRLGDVNAAIQAMATYKFYKLSFAGSRKSAKPRTLKTLRSTIKALFGSQLMEEDLDRLLEHLTRRGVIKIADGKVQYELPA